MQDNPKVRLALSIESENPGAANQTSLLGCNLQYPPMMSPLTPARLFEPHA